MKTNLEQEDTHYTFNKSPLFYLLLSFLCLLVYFIISQELGFFIDNNFSYLSRDSIPFGDYFQSQMKYFSKMQLSSILWKTLFLLPGIIFLTIFFALKISAEKFEIFLNNLKNIDALHLLLVLFGIAILLISFFAFFVLGTTNITDDEEAYRFQGKLLKEGMLYAPAPPVEKNFHNVFMITEGKFTGKYTIGFPAILALGRRIGNEYIFPIFFAAFSILLIYFVSMQLYADKNTSLLASFLLVLSPFYYMTSAILLTHSSMLFFLSLFMLFFLRTIKTGNYIYAVLFGICLGVAINIRPNTAVFFAVPFFCYSIIYMVRNKGKLFPQFLVSIITFGIFLVILFWYNKTITGNPFLFPFNYYDPTEKIGFGQMLKNYAYIHTPIKGLLNLITNIVKLNSWLFGIPLSLLFIISLLLFGKLCTSDLLNFSIILSVFFFQIFYYSPGVSDTGPVYYFELLLPLTILSARGIKETFNFLSELHFNSNIILRQFVPIFLIISFLFSFITFVPERTICLMNLADKIDEPYQRVKIAGIKNAVVFIRSTPMAGWVFGIRNNSPKLNDDVIYVRESIKEDNIKIMNYFPNRSYYVLRYNPEKGCTEISSLRY